MEKYYWLNEDSRLFLERGYLLPGEKPEQRIKDICDAAEKYLNIKGFSNKLNEYIANGWVSLSSPIWSNYGRERGLPISCNGSYVDDNMYEILGKAAEVGSMSKNGAGTSAYFGDIRSRGSKISSGGESSGPVHFMEIYESVTNVVSQSNIRRGSFAAYLPVEHPDIKEFLAIRSEGHPIQNMSIGVTISDEWMNSMLEGDESKRQIWGKIIKKRFESGYPYIFFSDTVNKNAPKVYKDKELRINASNLCVTGDANIEILIDDTGEKLVIRIQDLGFYIKKYKNVKVKSYDIDLDEAVFSKILDFAQTGESTEIVEIEDEAGNIIKCTPEHKIYTKNRGYIEAKDIKEDDILQNS